MKSFIIVQEIVRLDVNAKMGMQGIVPVAALQMNHAKLNILFYHKFHLGTLFMGMTL
jgi:hypothetical protein